MIRAIKNWYHLWQAVCANVVYGFPARKLTVIAITGTDGKTTTSTLLYHMLRAAGRKVALISTVAAYVQDEEIDTGFHVTTPSPFQLSSLLRKIATASSEYLVLEVTSHGIDQNRIWGIRPTYAAITNVTHEHLDYHRTYEEYLQTKAKLLLRARHIYLNSEAVQSYRLLTTLLSAQSREYQSVSVNGLSPKLKTAVTARFGTEKYNYENAAIACSIASAIGVDEKTLGKSIRTFPGIPGRMQEVVKRRGVRCVVDFAHTPAALKRALLSLRAQLKSGRLILVFGCAGLRDRSKRPLMGAIAATYADLVVLTAEDPRTEDVWAIIASIKTGVPKKQHGKIVSIPDRHEAIAFAYNTAAHSGDILLVAGKGHERSMSIKGVEYPWNDAECIHKVTESI